MEGNQQSFFPWYSKVVQFQRLQQLIKLATPKLVKVIQAIKLKLVFRYLFRSIYGLLFLGSPRHLPCACTAYQLSTYSASVRLGCQLLMPAWPFQKGAMFASSWLSKKEGLMGNSSITRGNRTCTDVELLLLLFQGTQ